MRAMASASTPASLEEHPVPQRKRAPLRFAWVLVPVAFFGLLTYGVLTKGTLPQPGDPAPPISGELLTGGSVAWEEFRGKPMVVNFWASWCKPCEEESPLMAEAHQAYGSDITFLGVNIRDARSDAIAFKDETEMEFQHVRDEQLEIYDRFGLTGQPETFFIDEDGVIVEHIPGPVDQTTLVQMLDLLVQRSA